MWPGQTECDAMTALQSVWTRCVFSSCMCLCISGQGLGVCVLRGTGLLIVRVWGKVGGVEGKEDSHFWFGLRRVTGTWSCSGMLYWKQSSLTTNKPSQTVSLPSDDFSLAFLVVKFHRGLKSFFFFCICSVTSWKQALVSVALVRVLMLWMKHRSLCLSHFHWLSKMKVHFTLLSHRASSVYLERKVV